MPALDDFRVSEVMVDGQMVARDGALTVPLEAPSRDDTLIGPFPMTPASPDDLSLSE